MDNEKCLLNTGLLTSQRIYKKVNPVYQSVDIQDILTANKLEPGRDVKDPLWLDEEHQDSHEDAEN